MEEQASRVDRIYSCQHTSRRQPARQFFRPALTDGEGIQVEGDGVGYSILNGNARKMIQVLVLLCQMIKLYA